MDIVLPPDKLLPTVPLRLNYLLWIEDLLNDLGIKENVEGIDIGCGSSCIYCLLAVRSQMNWKMFALEIDEENFKFAKDNVERNQLQDRITLVSQKDERIFGTLFESSPGDKTFCMCNPPFFKSVDDLIGENRSGKRKASRTAGSHLQSTVELIVDGGEMGFIRKILSESLELKEKVKIFSTMIGCKKNLAKFIDELSSHGVKNFTTTEFVQGKTMRWGIAWSFYLDLLKSGDKKDMKKSSHKVLFHRISSQNFSDTVTMIRSILNSLEIEIRVVKETDNQHSQLELFCTKNTWSNQRAKRRAEMRNQVYVNKSEESDKTNLKIAMEMKKSSEGNFVEINMFYLDGNMNKDCVNQILQFIKNELNKK